MARRPRFSELLAASDEYPPELQAAWAQIGVGRAALRVIALIERSKWREDHSRARPRCGAKARSTGGLCKAPTVPGHARCKLHGGQSTGPRTQAGRQRVAKASRERMLAYWSRQRSCKAQDC